MVRSRTWKLAAPALAGCLAWTHPGCGEPTPAAVPAEVPKVEVRAESAPVKTPTSKGKKSTDPTSEMGIKELREYRRKKAAESTTTP